MKIVCGIYAIAALTLQLALGQMVQSESIFLKEKIGLDGYRQYIEQEREWLSHSGAQLMDAIDEQWHFSKGLEARVKAFVELLRHSESQIKSLSKYQARIVSHGCAEFKPNWKVRSLQTTRYRREDESIAQLEDLLGDIPDLEFREIESRRQLEWLRSFLQLRARRTIQSHQPPYRDVGLRLLLLKNRYAFLRIHSQENLKAARSVSMSNIQILAQN